MDYSFSSVFVVIVFIKVGDVILALVLFEGSLGIR